MCLSAPKMVRIDQRIGPGDWVNANFRFSIIWRGQIDAPQAGEYAFGAESLDGSWVYVDGRPVVDNGGRHPSRYVEGRVTLSQGRHDIEVRYFVETDRPQMELYWTPPGTPKQIIPEKYLFPLEGAEIPADLVLPPVPTVRPTPVPTAGVPGAPSTPTKPESPATAVEPAPAAAVEFLWQAGSCGPGREQFQSPRGIATDNAGNVYVADAGNHRVVKLSPEGMALLDWGREGDGDGEFMEPFDNVAEANGDILVLDATAQQFQRFNAGGRFVIRFGKGLPFYRPRGLGIDAEGNLLVANTGRQRVVKLSAGGEIIQEYGGSGQAADMGQIVDVAAGPGGFLYVYVTEGESGLIWRLGPGGDVRRWRGATRASTMDGPQVAVGSDGAIYVTDPEKWRVVIYDSGGAALGEFGAEGTGEGQLQKPVGLAVDQAGRI